MAEGERTRRDGRDGRDDRRDPSTEAHGDSGSGTEGSRARLRGDRRAPAGAARSLDGQTRRRLQSRRRLLDAATALFVEHGYDRTRPQDIARHAGVATGTFYLHFRDKEDVFLAFADEAQTQLLEDCRERLEDVHGLTDRIRVFIRAMFDHAERNPGVLQVAFLDPVMIAPGDEDAWRLYDRFGQIFAEGLRDAMQHGLIHDDYDLDLVSHALGGLMRHGTIFGGRRAMDPDRIAEQLTRFIGRGLGADLHP